MAEDEAAWRCDLAETYGILDYKGLSVDTLAVLSSGLGENSRIMRKLRGEPYGMEITMQMAILDQLRLLTWMFSKDGAKGKNRPKSILEAVNAPERPEEKPVGYTSGAEFMRAREMWMKKEA